MPNKRLLVAWVHTPELKHSLEQAANQFTIHWLQNIYTDQRTAITKIADLNPSLLVIELDQPLDWLSTVRSDPATRRIPLIVFAADAAAEQRAMQYQAKAIIDPALFEGALAEVLEAHAHAFSQYDLLSAECDSSLPPLVRKGLDEFNSGDYFEAHETLESAWRSESGPVRELYRAILQVGIAYYQITRANYQGAQKMFVRSVQWFAPLLDQCQGIDVAQLRADAAAARAHLEALGPARIAEFDRSLLKPVRFTES